MFGIMAKLASAKTMIIVVAVTFTVGMGAGAWLLNKIYAHGKIAMLDAYIDKQAASHKKTIENLAVLHDTELKLARDAANITKVNDYVEDNRACDINADAERLLDNSRTGMSIPARRNDERLPRLAAITQRQQVKTCAKDGIQYREMKAHYDSLKQFIRDNWKQRHD